MGAFSIWHWVIILVVVLVLFGGKGKISGIMGDFGKGLKSFKKNIKEEVPNPEYEKTAQISETAEASKIEKDKTTQS